MLDGCYGASIGELRSQHPDESELWKQPAKQDFCLWSVDFSRSKHSRVGAKLINSVGKKWKNKISKTDSTLFTSFVEVMCTSMVVCSMHFHCLQQKYNYILPIRKANSIRTRSFEIKTETKLQRIAHSMAIETHVDCSCLQLLHNSLTFWTQIAE